MDKFKVGILTAGNIAGVMADTLREMENVERYAVAARDMGRAKEFAEKYGFTKAYGSYEELAADEEVDLIYIASPHSHHREHTLLCLNHGRNVLCEKAFAVNVGQAKEMIRLAEDKGLLLAEAIWVRYLPMAKKLQEVISSGVIGEISTVTANLHYCIDQVPRLREPALAGGALLDVGIYALTFASIALGDDVERIETSAAMTDTGVDAQSEYTLYYKNGAMAVLHSGTRAISDRQGVIYGRKGYIVVDNINNFECITVYGEDRKVIARYPHEDQISGYEYEVEACMEAIRQGRSECPDMPHAETVRMMEWMDRIREKLGIVYPCE